MWVWIKSDRVWNDWATGELVMFQFMFHTETEAVKCTKSKLWLWPVWLSAFQCTNHIKCTNRRLNWKECRQDLHGLKLKLAIEWETETTVWFQWGYILFLLANLVICYDFFHRAIKYSKCGASHECQVTWTAHLLLMQGCWLCTVLTVCALIPLSTLQKSIYRNAWINKQTVPLLWR